PHLGVDIGVAELVNLLKLLRDFGVRQSGLGGLFSKGLGVKIGAFHSAGRERASVPTVPAIVRGVSLIRWSIGFVFVRSAGRRLIVVRSAVVLLTIRLAVVRPLVVGVLAIILVIGVERILFELVYLRANVR